MNGRVLYAKPDQDKKQPLKLEQKTSITRQFNSPADIY